MGKRSGMLSPEIIQSGTAPLRIGVPPSENANPAILESPERHNKLESIKESSTLVSADARSLDRQVIDIPLELIDDNPYNARQIYNDADIKGLASSIHRESQLQPIVVTPNPEKPGRYIGIDGKRRRLAIELLDDRKTIQAKVVPAEDAKKLYLISYITNEEREQHTDMDNGLSWAKLLENKVFANQSELARALGKDRTVVNRTLCYAQLPGEVIDLFKQDPKRFSLVFAIEVSAAFKESGADAAKTLAQYILDSECSQREAHAYRQKMMHATEAPGRPRSRRYPIVRNGTEIGSIKEWDSGKLVVELSGMSEAQRIKIKAAIEDSISQVAN